MLTVHEIQDKRAKKTLLGPSTKEGRREKKAIGRKKAAMMKLLDERALWMVLGTDKSINSVRLSDEDVKQMLRTGEGPWSSGGSELYWGRIVHRCRSDIARCKEELPVLQIEKARLQRWASRTCTAVDARWAIVGEECGQGILLRRWRKLLGRIMTQITNLKW